MKSPNSVLSSYGTTVFEVMSRLAIEHDAINLGQGFPDSDGPADILEAAAEALVRGPNQYPPMLGLPALRQAVAAHAQRFASRDGAGDHFEGARNEVGREVYAQRGGGAQRGTELFVRANGTAIDVHKGLLKEVLVM